MSPSFTLDPTLVSAAGASLEAAINKILQYDPATRQRVQQLQGRSLSVEITEFGASICVLFEADRVGISAFADNPDTRLKGSLPALIRLARSENTNLAEAGVSASGDIELLVAVRRIISDLEFDWEEAINDRLGDLTGHQLAQGVRGQLQWLRERGNAGRRLLGEFLTEELRAVPSAAELQYFNDQVDDLRLECDRLQARVQRLSQVLAERGN